MTERQQLHRRHGRAARSGTRAGVRPRSTVPTDLTLLGLPAEPDEDPREETDDRDGLVALHRPDAPAGTLLLVAGAAGGMSLFLPWLGHGGQLGVTLVRHAVDLASDAPERVVGSGLALPLGVAAGGGVLFLLGLLAFRPARSHRLTGVVALAVSLAVAAGVLVRVTGAGSTAVLTDPGVLCAVVLAALGLLGSLKAMLTAPAVSSAGTTPR